jgi:pimeloyl-ACP methyl ester carboxylesterase
MATYVLIHGAGDVAWYWHLVDAELRGQGHDVIAADLPCDVESAGLTEYTDTVLRAIGDRRDLVVVGQSLGGYTAPLVCARVPARLLVFVAGMVPAPGESAEEMFANTGYVQDEQEDKSDFAMFYHDVPAELATEAMAKSRNQAMKPWQEPWPLASRPRVPTRFLLGRNDRVFPAEWMRRVARDRLGIAADEIDSGHCPALSRPKELAQRLDSWARTASGAPSLPS